MVVTMFWLSFWESRRYSACFMRIPNSRGATSPLLCIRGSQLRPPARTSTGPCGKPWWLSHTAQSASAAFRNVAKPCGRPSFDLLATPGAVDTPITWHGARDYIMRQRREALGHLEGTHGSRTCLPVVFLVP